MKRKNDRGHGAEIPTIYTETIFLKFGGVEGDVAIENKYSNDEAGAQHSIQGVISIAHLKATKYIGVPQRTLRARDLLG